MSDVGRQGGPSRGRAELALLAVCVVWGCNFSVMKVGLADLQPAGFNTIRLTMSALLLGAMHFLGGGRRTRLTGRQWRDVLGLSLLGYFAYQVLFMAGLARTASGNAALIVASAPVFTFVLARWMGDRPRRLAFLGMGIAFAGTASIALSRGVDLDDQLLVGNLLVLGAAVAWGTFTALSRGSAVALPPTTLAFYCTAVALPLHWWCGAAELGPLFAGEVRAATWFSLAYSGLLGTGVALVLFNVGLRGAGASYTAGLVSLVPVLALVVGAVALAEPITGLQIFGGACVVGGVWLIRVATPAGPPVAPPAPACSRSG